MGTLDTPSDERAVLTGILDGSFVPDPDLTVEAAIAAYGEACAVSRAVTAAMDLDAAGALPHVFMGTVTRRYVLAHMIEETGRPAGRTGDG